MILSLFLPPYIFKRQIYSQKILSIYIDTTCLKAVLIKKGNFDIKLQETYKFEFTKKKVVYPYLNLENPEIESALLELKKKIKNFDSLKITIPSISSTIKQHETPLFDIEKIRKALEFDIETLLPFDSKKGSFSFFITKKNKDKSILSIASIKMSDALKIKNFTHKTLGAPNNLFLDVPIIYDMCKKSSIYLDDEHITILLNFQSQAITINFFTQDSILSVRQIEFNFDDFLATKISHPQKLIEELLVSGINNQSQDQDQLNFANFIEKKIGQIKLAIDSFLVSLPPSKRNINKILIIQSNIKVNNLSEAINKQTGINCEEFSTYSFIKNLNINSNSHENDFIKEYSLPIGAAIHSDSIDNFNLGENIFDVPSKKLVKKILTLCFLLCFSLFFYLIYTGLGSINNLEKSIEEKERVIKDTLIKLLPKNYKINKKTKNSKMVADLKEELKKQNQDLFLNGMLYPDLAAAIIEVSTKIVDRSRFGTKVEVFEFEQKKDGSFNLTLEGEFDLSKSATPVDDYSSMIKNISSSKIIHLIKDESNFKPGDNLVNFKIILGLENENL